MATALHTNQSHVQMSAVRGRLRQVSVGRAAVAILWALALVVALRGRDLTTSSGVPAIAALLLATYPLIDVAASLIASRSLDASVLRINAALSALGAVGIAIGAFAVDAGATLVAFGAWAVISGAFQLGIGLRRRRRAGGQIAGVISGALSIVAGFSFIAGAAQERARLVSLAGYMALGAVLFLLSARRDRASRL